MIATLLRVGKEKESQNRRPAAARRLRCDIRSSVDEGQRNKRKVKGKKQKGPELKGESDLRFDLAEVTA